MTGPGAVEPGQSFSGIGRGTGDGELVDPVVGQRGGEILPVGVPPAQVREFLGERQRLDMRRPVGVTDPTQPGSTARRARSASASTAATL